MRSPARLGLFEIDEFWLDQITPQLQPRAVLLGNLFRDQLDRYGELETIADRWAAVVASLAPTARLVLNADDPLIADLGRNAPNVTYFGIEDPSVAMPEMQHASDSKHCRRCGAAYSYEAIYLGHLGRYRCPNCGQERPAPKVAAEQISLDGTRGAALPGAHADRVVHGQAPPARPLQRLQRAGRGGAVPRAGHAVGDGGRRPGRVTAAFGRAERVRIGPPSCRSC